jgi:hypothetical protein
MRKAMEGIHWQATSLGFQKHQTNSSEPVSQKELQELKRSNSVDEEEILVNMDKWLNRSPQSTKSAFSSYEGLKTDSEGKRKTYRRKHSGFNLNSSKRGAWWSDSTSDNC